MAWKNYSDHPIVVAVGLLLVAIPPVYLIYDRYFAEDKVVSLNEPSSGRIDPNASSYEKKINGATVPLMIDIPGGTALIGCSAGDIDCFPDEHPARKLTVRPFRIAKYETTQAQYYAIIESLTVDSLPLPSHPITNVTWVDVVKYIDLLNRRLKPVKPYRLPSEIEWEYAARASSDKKFHWGNTPPTCDQDAANGSNIFYCQHATSYGTMQVGSFQPNAFGIFDVHGNVREWVRDCFSFRAPCKITCWAG